MNALGIQGLHAVCPRARLAGRAESRTALQHDFRRASRAIARSIRCIDYYTMFMCTYYYTIYILLYYHYMYKLFSRGRRILAIVARRFFGEAGEGLTAGDPSNS